MNPETMSPRVWFIKAYPSFGVNKISAALARIRASDDVAQGSPTDGGDLGLAETALDPVFARINHSAKAEDNSK